MMSDVIVFNAAKKRVLKKRKRGNGLCQEGFHKWKVVKNNHFDSKQGKLVTLMRCERCGKEKVTSR